MKDLALIKVVDYPNNYQSVDLGELKDIEIGDLVEAMRARDLIVRLGIIVKKKEKVGPFEMDMFEVLLSDGVVENYTSAALRKLSPPWDDK